MSRPQSDLSMFRHAIVLGVAVLVALCLAQQVMKFSIAPGSASALAQAAPAAPADAPAQVASPPSSQAAQVVKAADGHYWAEAQVNGRWGHCLIDTGASAVALTRQDAERLGLDPAALVYDLPVVTANGQTHAARIELEDVSVAGARVTHVPAMVVKDGLSTSLLGMSYLGKLSRFEATPTSLVLRP